MSFANRLEADNSFRQYKQRTRIEWRYNTKGKAKNKKYAWETSKQQADKCEEMLTSQHIT